MSIKAIRFYDSTSGSDFIVSVEKIVSLEKGSGVTGELTTIYLVSGQKICVGESTESIKRKIGWVVED